MKDEILVDGSMGEGGGQILRAALALSMSLGRPFRMKNIRAGRPSPGLKRQHLACVRAAGELCGAEVAGDEMASRELRFAPGPLRAGEYHFAVGGGGSATLLLQAVLPPLLTADTPSRITVTGGTHVPCAPPFEFMAGTLLPWLERMGPRLAATMSRPGYMQLGGGSVTVSVTPAKALVFGTDFAEAAKNEPGPTLETEALVYAHHLPDEIAKRECAALLSPEFAALGLSDSSICVINGRNGGPRPEGAGNAVLVKLRHRHGITVFGETGLRGRSAETVAGHAACRALRFRNSNAPVEKHLADQLVVPLALAGGGSFVTETLTPHCRACLDVASLFTSLKPELHPVNGRKTLVTLR